MLRTLDHVNLRTPDIQKMVDWYERVLGLKNGPRPDIPVPGAWLYLGKTPVIHLVLDTEPMPREPTSLEHFAFRAHDMTAFEEKLISEEIPFERQGIPGTKIVQFNIHDPMGNHLHVDFDEGQIKAARSDGI